jgi:hypothetical protein
MHARQIKERIGFFIAASAGIEVLAIDPRLGRRRERGKQFVTGRVFGGVSHCVHEIDGGIQADETCNSTLGRCPGFRYRSASHALN